MLTITAICDQYAWLYQTTLPEPDGTWDHVIGTDGCYAAVKVVDDIWYLMFRGSVTFKDWWDDFDDVAIPFWDHWLGPVHPGARDGVLSVKDQLDDLLPRDGHVVIVGHSLGAMHAALYAGYRITGKLTMDALIMFGEPRAGGQQLSEIIAASGIDVQSFRNAEPKPSVWRPIAHDVITDVARSIPPDLPYQHVRDPLTDVYHQPRADDPWLIFKWHHFGHYCRAFGCGTPQALALPI